MTAGKPKPRRYRYVSVRGTCAQCDNRRVLCASCEPIACRQCCAIPGLFSPRTTRVPA